MLLCSISVIGRRSSSPAGVHGSDRYLQLSKGGKKVLTVIIKDKVTQSYIGEIDVYKDEISILSMDFIVIAKQ